jgi:hypothetical protein
VPGHVQRVRNVGNQFRIAHTARPGIFRERGTFETVNHIMVGSWMIGLLPTRETTRRLRAARGFWWVFRILASDAKPDSLRLDFARYCARWHASPGCSQRSDLYSQDQPGIIAQCRVSERYRLAGNAQLAAFLAASTHACTHLRRIFGLQGHRFPVDRGETHRGRP